MANDQLHTVAVLHMKKKRTPGTHSIGGGWVGLRASLDMVAKRKNSAYAVTQTQVIPFGNTLNSLDISEIFALLPCLLTVNLYTVFHT
jgi:hypothetical protein